MNGYGKMSLKLKICLNKIAINQPVAAIITYIFGPLQFLRVSMVISLCVRIAVEYVESLLSGLYELVPECSTPLLFSFVLEFLSEKDIKQCI